MKIPFGLGGKKDNNDPWIPENYYEDEYIEEADADYAENTEYTEEVNEEYAEDVDGEYVEYVEYVEDVDGEYVEYVEDVDGEYVEYAEGAEEEYVEEYPTEELSGLFAAGRTAEIFYEEDAYAAESYEEDYEQSEYGESGYQDIVYEEEDEEDHPGIFGWIRESGMMDRLVMIGGAAVLLLVLVVGFVFIGSKVLSQDEEKALNVGKQIVKIDTIGGKGLLAVSDAQKAALEAAKVAEEEKEEEKEEKPPVEYEEEEYKIEVNVKLSMSSIEKDLKIKFINEETGKLVGNVPFSIMVTGPNGKETLWSDDDMDGIIYKKNLAAGSYKVKVNDFEEEKYKKYGIPSAKQKVEVKAKIDYNKVDVSNEVKSESQVDVQKEDTKKNETVVEGYLADTVPWVESTATLVSYTEVDKSNIVDPMQLVTAGSVLAMSTVKKESIALMSAGFALRTLTTEVSGGDAQTSPSPTPSESPSPTPSESPSPAPSESPSPTPSESPSPTPTPSPMVIKLEKKDVVLFMDHPVSLAVSVENLMEEAVITVESSDKNVMTAKIEDKTLIITGVAAGKATITVNCIAEVKITEPDPEGGEAVETTQTYKAEPVSCTVEVRVNPKKDTTTLLLDNEKREVYVLDGTEYRQAHPADYYTYSKFFVKGEAKYTGWQTLEGKRYFFDAAGKKVTGEQVIQGVKYNFASDGSLVTGSGTLGIDVSKWNGNIDWSAVKKSGISYVIIRCGYRGSSQGSLIKDSKFESNIKGAINAGLKVGVYFFTQALDKNEALEEASMVLDCVKNYTISYPIFLDVEPSGGRADGLDVATRTEVCKTFCETIQKYGYTAGIYANKTWLNEKINTGELSGSYKIWLAQYASAPTYTGRYDMWQYKSTGKIDGITGDVDMNLSYLGY